MMAHCLLDPEAKKGKWNFDRNSNISIQAKAFEY